jgi:hypothetical protein
MEFATMQVELLDKPIKQRLLYSREQLAELLGGVSVSRIMQLEREGRITAITLTGRSSGQKFFEHDAVMSLLKDLTKQAEKRKGKIKRKTLAA